MHKIPKSEQRRLIYMVAALSALAAVLSNRPGLAVILRHGDPLTNTTAPEQDPGWDNIGVHGSGTAIYLGDRWVLTADHLTVVDAISFRGAPMAVERGSETRLSNPPGMGLSRFTDLRLVRLQDDPGLPSLPISARPAQAETEALVIGRGLDREDEQTFWHESGKGPRSEWTETDSSTFDRAGFKIASTQTKRWGTNLVVVPSEADDESFSFEAGAVIYAGSSDILSMSTRFDEVEGTEFESHATPGDSGGGLFVDEDGQWKLAGVMLSVTSFDGQPRRTSVFGNLTASADLSYYRDQIEAIVRGAALQAGDANQDHVFDQLDLVQVLVSGKYLTGKSATWEEGDWNGAPGGSSGSPPVGDGLFDQLDIVSALASGNYLSGAYSATWGDEMDGGHTAENEHALVGQIAVDLEDAMVLGHELSAINVLGRTEMCIALDAAQDDALCLGGIPTPEPNSAALATVGLILMIATRLRFNLISRKQSPGAGT